MTAHNDDVPLKTMTRGYTMLNLSGTPSVVGASLDTNVLIKKRLPVRGLVSSNPKRVERLLQTAKLHGMFENVTQHTDGGWGIIIWTATFQGVEIFVAVVPIGTTGAAFAFFEMYSAGAQAILRFGAGSDRKRDAKPREIVVVDEASNMDSLQFAAGKDHLGRASILKASEQLVKLLETKAKLKDMPAKRMICINVEDYHAYNFSELFDSGDTIRERIATKVNQSNRERCWDMETAALFWRAEQFGMHAATILVPVQANEGLETEFYSLMLESLKSFIPLKAAPASTPCHRRSWSRKSRNHTTNDRIGTDEPLFSMEDVETGMGLFID